MRISITDATDILNQVMLKLGHAEADLYSIVDHLIDCELRGLSYGGLARAVAVTERIGRLVLDGAAPSDEGAGAGTGLFSSPSSRARTAVEKSE